MSGKITFVPKAAHQCSGLPVAELYRAATQWTCNECGQIWVVVVGAQYNESYSAWRKLTNRNREGRDL